MRPHPEDTKLIQPPWPRDLPSEEVTIGEIMGESGLRYRLCR